jgi:hypothetical protein
MFATSSIRRIAVRVLAALGLCASVSNPTYAALAGAAPQNYGWHELANTAYAPVCPPKNFNGYAYDFPARCRALTLAWSSGAYDTKRNRLYLWGGGHDDYYGNEVYSVDFETQTTKRLNNPGRPALRSASPRQSELEPFNGTQPNSRHTYDGFTYMENVDRVWAFSGALAGGNSRNVDRLTWMFNPATARWQRQNASGDIPAAVVGGASAYDPVTGLVYLHDRTGLYSYQANNAGGVYRRLKARSGLGLTVNAAIDPVHRRFIAIGLGQFTIYNLDPASGYERIDPPLLGDVAFLDAQAPGLAYDDRRDRMVAWTGDGRVYELDPETLAWSAVAFKGGPGPQPNQGTYGRWAYASDLDAFVVYNTSTQNAYTFRPMVGVTDTTAPSAPGNLVLTSPYPGAVHLRWAATDDDVGVASYRIYHNDALVAERNALEFKEMDLPAGSRHRYAVVAVDSAGNESPRSTSVEIQLAGVPQGLPLGDCANESALQSRSDIVFCEPWESSTWWTKGYQSDPTVAAPRPAVANTVKNTRVVSAGCMSGKCLEVSTLKGALNSLSAYWPLLNAGLAPRNLYMRYYIKLAPNWNPNMCNAAGTVVGAGGKFPGPADVRTSVDNGGQCGNGGNPADGTNCWSMRSHYRDCSSNDGMACSTKPNAVARFGSYLYYNQQSTNTGDVGYWDNDDWGPQRGGGGTCANNPMNLYCGKQDFGVLEPGRWYQIEIQTTMNTPGEDDGVVRGWVDGHLAYEKTNLQFRKEGHDLLHNRHVWLNIYRGGKFGNCSDSAVYLDQMVLATDAPVGGLSSVTVRPPEVNLSVSSNIVAPQSALQVTWDAKHATSCTASGLWSGNKPVSGNVSLGPLTGSGEVRLECAGSGGTTLRMQRVTVTTPRVSAGGASGVAMRADNVPPAMPSGLQASYSAALRRVTLRWAAPADPSDVVAYQVYLGALPIGVVRGTELVHDNVPATGVVSYTVAAMDAAGNVSPRSKAFNYTVPGAAPPRTSAGPILTFAPISDTYVTPSTNVPRGNDEALYVNSSHNALLSFPVVLPQGFTIKAAYLRLTSEREYGPLMLGVFRAARPWHESQATHAYADLGAKLRWSAPGGDWLDANGLTQGDRHFVRANLKDDDVSNTTKINVTAVARAWLTSPEGNTGLVLRAMNRTSGQSFFSNDAPTGQVRLEIHTMRIR